MKKSARFISLMLLLAISAFYFNCDNGDSPSKSDRDQQIELLNGTWKIQTAKLDGADQDYTGFQLQISGTTGSNVLNYVATSLPTASSWPASGTLEFGTAVKESLVRDDEVQITYSVSANSLTMSYNFSGDPYISGRTKNVSGNWVFTFTK